MSIRRNIPPRPSGDDAFYRWCQWVHDRLAKKLYFNNSPTVKVNERENGFTFDAAPAARGAVTSGATVQQMLVIAEADDTGDPSPFTLACYKWDDITQVASGELVYVTKPYLLQNVAWTAAQYARTGGGDLQISYQPLVIDSVTSANKRQSCLGAWGGANPVYNEVIYPGYLSEVMTDDMTIPDGTPRVTMYGIIDAIQIPIDDYGNLWLALGDDRKWMKEVAVCTGLDGSAVELALIDATATYPAANALDFTVI